MEKILKILEDNPKVTAEQISTMTSIPMEEVKELIKQAEKEKIILRYKSIIDWAKLGKEEVWALIEVKVTPQRDLGFDSIAERISRFPEVHSIYLVSGVYDLAIIIEGKTMQEVANFVSGKLAPMERVQSTVTHFVLKRYKEDGEILHPGEEFKRLPITP
jgi:DNA-binding Lrp family transcriptional regulator